MSAETIRDALDRALDAYTVLAELGEGIEDEWSYVNDLTDAWKTRFDEVIARHGDDDASDETSQAIDRAIDEIQRIEDPHRGGRRHVCGQRSAARQIDAQVFPEVPDVEGGTIARGRRALRKRRIGLRASMDGERGKAWAAVGHGLSSC